MSATAIGRRTGGVYFPWGIEKLAIEATPTGYGNVTFNVNAYMVMRILSIMF